jgi:hypothetical protein
MPFFSQIISGLYLILTAFEKLADVVQQHFQVFKNSPYFIENLI